MKLCVLFPKDDKEPIGVFTRDYLIAFIGNLHGKAIHLNSDVVEFEINSYDEDAERVDALDWWRKARRESA